MSRSEDAPLPPPLPRRGALTLVLRRGGATREYLVAENGALLDHYDLEADDDADPSGFWTVDVVD